MSRARRSTLMSGCRRMTPVAEHGTSSRMRSNGRPSHQPGGLGHVAGHHAGVESQPTKVAADPLQARLGQIERRDFGLPRHPLEQMAGLSARRSAGVQDPLARPRPEHLDRELGGGVLHRQAPLRESGQGFHVRRRVDPERIRRVRVPVHGPARGLEFGRAAVDVGAHAIHPEPHRRVRIVRLQDGLALPRTLAAQRRHEPAGMRRADRQVAVHGREHRIALPLEAPEHRIHEAGAPRMSHRFRGADRLRRPPRARRLRPTAAGRGPLPAERAIRGRAPPAGARRAAAGPRPA